jgi:CubicO group peptidase (beta-lactamase class C family)
MNSIEPSNEQALRKSLEAYMESGALAGAATLVWRHGRIEQLTCVGTRDLTTGLPVERDTIFRIASMTKPVTAVAALIQLEADGFTLDEPIVRHAPELADMRVLLDPNGPLDHTVPAQRAITFRDLLTHRSGLTYPEFHRGPIGRAYAETLGATIDNPLHPNEWIARLATLPLIDQPGAGFHYGSSMDLLGFLIARIAGGPFGEVLDRTVFRPLRMRDTAFMVPHEKRLRRAGLSGFDENGHLIARTTTPGGHAVEDRPEDMSFESGGQGLWSTLDDYLSFARLFVGGGEVDGVRLLRADTVAAMMSNQLTDDQRASARMFGRPLFARGHGYGMGVANVMEPEHADPLRCRGGIGTVGWPGAYGGWWQADPNDQSVLIFLSHNMAELHQMASGIGLDVWSAIAKFHALATA